MAASRDSAIRRTGHVLTGLGALAVLIGLLGGAPIALLAFAGNPLPDHLPTLGEITSALTSRDDGQLFLRALAIVGWAGWATFALSVLVELPARALRRPAPRLPGLGRQQRVAAALVGSIAVLVASPALATAAPRAPAAPAVATAPHAISPAPVVGAAAPAGPAPRWLADGAGTDDPAPVYRVEKGDYLGHIAGRYLGEFDRYPELARLNKIRDPNRIRTGQLLHLPAAAADHGVRRHATGVVAVPPPPGGWEDGPAPEPAPDHPVDPSLVDPPSSSDGITFAVGASRAGKAQELNRPLAVSAVIAVASMVGAQIGALLGLRRRTAASRAGTGRVGDSGRHRIP